MIIGFVWLKISRGWKESMRNSNPIPTRERNQNRPNLRFRKVVQCLCSCKRSNSPNEMIPSSESTGTKDYSISLYSSQTVGENDKKPDTVSIEEAELSLRESGSLNYEVRFPIFSINALIKKERKKYS